MTDAPDTRLRKRIVILTPVFNEEESLPVYEKTIKEVLLARTDHEVHVLFVDDGSTDRSWHIIVDICKRDARFSGLRLSRNFGSHVALAAALTNAEGDAMATLACDLQDPPEVILEFIRVWETGPQIVWGARRSREDATWRKLCSALFYRLLRRHAMPPGSAFSTGSFFLLDKHVAEAFCRLPESNRITFALVAWCGFDQAVVEYDRKTRIAGKSGWSFGRMIHAMYDAFIGFSTLPIRLTTGIGLFVFLFSMLFGLYVLVAGLTKVQVPGWTSIVLSMTFFFGLQFLILGLMGEYLYRIYREVLRRPLYFISHTTDEQRDDER